MMEAAISGPKDGAQNAEARLQAIRVGGKAAVARALTRLETAPESPETAALLDAALAAPRGPAIGLTGPPGVGKSTLIDALIRAQRARGASIAIIAVDPSSKRSGGAVLGDRTRFSTDPTDTNVFVRSMAARDRLGGISEQAYPASVLLRAVYDLTVIETVGVGQSETEVAEIADAVVFCIQPGSGDSLQFMKAGVMETPDLLLVTKADLGAPARRAASDARSALSLAAHDGAIPEVQLVSAADGASGVSNALAAMIALGQSRRSMARRLGQAQAWSERETVLAFGREGAAMLATAAPVSGTEGQAPFADHARRMAALRAVFAKASASATF